MTEAEQEKSESTPTSELERKRQDLLNRLDQTEFGSGVFQAFSDYFSLKTLKKDLTRELNNLHSGKDDEQKKPFRESNVRITEMQIALLEQDIERKRATLPGYAGTETDLGIFLDDTLPILARQISEEKYPSDEEMRKKYSHSIYIDIHTEIFDLVNVRQSKS